MIEHQAQEFAFVASHDGREALTRIKADPEIGHIPVLIVTTSKEDRDIVFTKETGASSFLSKPEVFEELIEMLHKFCTAIMDNSSIPFQVMGC